MNKLQLALAIISGRIKTLTQRDCELLGYNYEYYCMSNNIEEIKIRAEQIIYDLITGAYPIPIFFQ